MQDSNRKFKSYFQHKRNTSNKLVQPTINEPKNSKTLPEDLKVKEAETKKLPEVFIEEQQTIIETELPKSFERESEEIEMKITPLKTSETDALYNY